MEPEVHFLERAGKNSTKKTKKKSNKNTIEDCRDKGFCDLTEDTIEETKVDE